MYSLNCDKLIIIPPNEKNRKLITLETAKQLFVYSKINLNSLVIE